MNFVVKRIWWMVLPTVMAVLAFQCYWLFSAYDDQREAMAGKLRNALQDAYQEAFLEKLSIAPANMPQPGALQVKETRKSNSAGISAGVTINTTFPDNDSATVFPTARISSGGNKVSPFFSSILSVSPEFRPDTQLLAKHYRKQLGEIRIPLPFQLQYSDKQLRTDSGGLHVNVRYSSITSDDELYAWFTGERMYLLQRMTGPFAISLLLMLIVAGCIWVLWRIILRQKTLEAMRNDFISNMTHELKTPVAVLSTINDALLTYNGINDQERAERYLRLSRDELNKLETHIEEILRLSTMENGMNSIQREPVSLPAVLSAVEERFNHLPGVIVRKQLSVKEQMLLTHEASLFTILNNLVDNAVKYTTNADKQIMVAVKENEKHYQFSVTDNGIGIHASHLPYLFDKFYRVPHGDLHDVKGYGLGLSHVKALVTQLGGTIQVTSKPGAGSTFTFQLPRA